MDKEHIINEIKRTARENGGKPLGRGRFESETCIRTNDWFGKYATTWNELVIEAGFEPNSLTVAYEDDILLEKLVLLTRKLNRVPTIGDMLLERSQKDHTFPSEKVFRRFGAKPQRAKRVIAYCEAHPKYMDVANLWREVTSHQQSQDDEITEATPATIGYVYLIKHGSRQEYKIGKTNNVLRREGEIRLQLPHEVIPIHHIRTDDPAGVEAYWHKRFANKRKKGEWFELTAQDVAAFKKWKRII